MSDRITITNPLPAALEHYAVAFEETLGRIGISPQRRPSRPVEGLRGRRGRIAMLRNAFLNVKGSRDGRDPNVQLWSSLGLLEPRLWSGKHSKNIVVIHDPIPLRRQTGHDEISRILAQRSPSRRIPATVLVHSQDAREEICRILPNWEVVAAPLPIRTNLRTPPVERGRTVLVAGQYKPERRLDLLRDLGPMLAERGIRGLVLGRGWPGDILGWEVTNRFVQEQELDEAIGAASVVLIPYARYYQSDIAVRAIEAGTPFISPDTSFAIETLGQGSPLVVDRSASAMTYLLAIEEALSRANAKRLFREYRSHVDSTWKSVFSSFFA